MKEIAQQRLLELEQRTIQADLEKARREKLEAEQRKAELEAQVKVIEEKKLKEEQRIRQEDRERKHQQQEAEHILKELDERRKRIAAVASHHEEIARKTPEDVIIDGEIDRMKEELFGPDGQLDEAKMGFAGHLSRYPSREYLAEGQQENLTRRERKYYEEKERFILAKISITDSTYCERRMYQRNETQAQNFQLEYQSILAELKRQLVVCQRMLKLPNAPIPNYPSPVSVKTPPSIELEKEEIEYYLDKFEEIQKRDQHATRIHVRRLEEVEESEQKLCYLPMAEYERRSKLQRQKINYALSKKRKETQTT